MPDAKGKMLKLIILNWVGIGLAVAIMIASFILKEIIPWWMLPIWLAIVIISKSHILHLLSKELENIKD